MVPIWLLAAFAGLAVGMVYAWLSNKRAARSTITPLDPGTVEEITDLVARRKHLRAATILRKRAGHTLIDARNRAEDWDPEQERRAAR